MGPLLLSLTEIMYYSDVLAVIPAIAVILLFMEMFVALPRMKHNRIYIFVFNGW